MRAYDIAFITLICVLLILAAGLILYLVTWAVWRKIDIISSRAIAYVRSGYDSAFDEEIFRVQVRGILDQLAFLNGNRVIFHAPFYERRKNWRTLNAHTAFPGQKVIILMPGWAARLHREFGMLPACGGIEGRDDGNSKCCLPTDYGGRGTMTDLLLFTLGHEMAHKEGQYRPLFLFGKKRICAARIREIDADLCSLRKTGLSASRVSACIHAEILKKNRRCDDRLSRAGRMNHPAWAYRIKCMKAGTLSGAMIDEICRDCGVSDPKFCERVKKYYLESLL